MGIFYCTVGVMSDNWRPKPYNSEPPRWVPRWLTLRMTSLLLWPTLASYSLLYLIWPTIYRNWWDRIDDTVILGALPLSCHVPTLYTLGVRGVINACAEGMGPVEAYSSYGIEKLRIPVVSSYSPTLEDVLVAMKFIQRHRESGASVLEPFFIHSALPGGDTTQPNSCLVLPY